jgi:NAD(P)-dependent dehydrogenase (short-subunit alcohol dehydrogenase family)
MNTRTEVLLYCATRSQSLAAVWQARVRRETPLGVWGLPEDVAKAAVWLASPAAAFLTGQTIRVNGGAVR